MDQIDISIVVPLLNEQHTLVELYTQLSSVMEQLGKTFEVVFVDDGSTDQSWNEIMRLHSSSQHVKGIKFRKNFRKAAALSAGFSQARGDIIVTIDADLQDDPRSIPALLEKLNDGYHLVSGWKQERKDSRVKIVASSLFNFVTSLLTGVRLHDFNCCLKAYRRDVIDVLHLYGDLHRFIPVLAAQYGFRCGEVQVPHFPRQFGKSHFGGLRLFEGLFDIFTVWFITRYLNKPSRVFSSGALLALLAVIFLCLCGFLGVSTTTSFTHWATLACIAIAVAVQLFSLSLIAEMLTFLLSERQRTYTIEKILK